MPKSANQKIKLLQVLEILRMNSDEDHSLTINDLIGHLKARGIESARKALYDDIRILNEYGYEIMCEKSAQNRYYIEDRTFDVAELKILLDAVQSASFITEKKTKDLVCKIANLAGSYKANLLLENIVCFNTNKHTNEKIYYSVDTLNRAIIDKKKVSFYYFDYDIAGRRVYRKDKERYIVNPVALIFSDNNYYLTCYNDKYKTLSNYRVDKMDNVEKSEEEQTEAKCAQGFDICRHRSQAFSMFVGSLRKVTLEVNNSLIDVVIDKFGENLPRTVIDDDRFRITVEIQISPTFFSWVTMFGQKMKITSPSKVIEQYVLAIKDTLAEYEK